MTGAPITSAGAEKENLSPVATETAPTPDGEEPNDYEKSTLRRIGENLPASAYLIAIVELTERFTYYGAQGLFQNYISFSEKGADGPRGLGMGNQAATGLNLFFQWFCYGKETLHTPSRVIPVSSTRRGKGKKENPIGRGRKRLLLQSFTSCYVCLFGK